MARPSRDAQNLENEDVSFIVRFDEDRTFVVLNYMSKALVGLDVLERLSLNKNDQVKVKFSSGIYDGVIWFRGNLSQVCTLSSAQMVTQMTMC